MTSARDPSNMTLAERLREVSHLFAQAYVRLLFAREETHNHLAQPAESEAPCDRTVNRLEINPKEVT